jgi:hypothetical protein
VNKQPAVHNKYAHTRTHHAHAHTHAHTPWMRMQPTPSGEADEVSNIEGTFYVTDAIFTNASDPTVSGSHEEAGHIEVSQWVC